MGARRPQKIWKLNYAKASPEFAAKITLFGDPAEIRVAANESTFMSVRGDDTFGGLTLSPGRGNNINIQAMSGNMRYAGMLQDLPFPLSIVPTTPFTPWPNQMIRPPLENLVPVITQMAIISSSFVGI